MSFLTCWWEVCWEPILQRSLGTRKQWGSPRRHNDGWWWTLHHVVACQETTPENKMWKSITQWWSSQAKSLHNSCHCLVVSDCTFYYTPRPDFHSVCTERTIEVVSPVSKTIICSKTLICWLFYFKHTMTEKLPECYKWS